MNDNRKRHYPADRDKLHALCERLEAEIAERQERLAEVRKLAIAADNAAIINTVKTHNITPEELAQVVEMIRSGNPMPQLGIAEDESVKPAKARKETKKDGSFEPEENEDEKT